MSLSSYIISQATSFRNPNGSEQVWTQTPNKKPVHFFEVLVAEVAYIATVPFAIVELAFAATAKVLTLCLPLREHNHIKMTAWMVSSAFSIGWAIAAICMNPLLNDLIEELHL